MKNKSVILPGETLKWCSGCQTEKPVEDFHKNRSRPDGLQNYCKACAMEAQKSSESKHPKTRALRRRRTEIQKKYGMSLEDFDTMLWDQNGRCPICAREMEEPHVHASSLLCDTCYAGLGQFQESTDLLFRAISYLDSYKVPRVAEVRDEAYDENV
jgi:hypothetical protein